jgi:hypothetical protein
VPSGAKTELQKIIEGLGDWLFYGFAIDDGGVDIAPWYIVDLDYFRANLIRRIDRQEPWVGQKRNGDGSWLAWFDLRHMPADVVLATDEKIPYAEAQCVTH